MTSPSTTAMSVVAMRSVRRENLERSDGCHGSSGAGKHRSWKKFHSHRGSIVQFGSSFLNSSTSDGESVSGTTSFSNLGNFFKCGMASVEILLRDMSK